MEMNLLHVKAENIGYGNMSGNIVRALKARDLTIYDSLPGDHDTEQSKICNTVHWHSIPSHARGWRQGQYTSILTMWEATRLPETFRESMHEFDVVIVPSQHNLELFSDYHPNVKKINLGIDPNVWKYYHRNPTTFFNFLTAGSGSRKGNDLAYNAFNKVFGDYVGDGPIPRLIMKTPRGGSTYVGENIENISGWLSLADEVELYKSAHCYLGPSRGEGFGLQPLQAIAQGLPTILTDAHGHAEFAHLGFGVPAKLTKADYFSFGDAGDWWEPDFDILCDTMKWVYDNYDFAAKIACEAAEVAKVNYTWDKSASQLIDALGKENLETPYSGDGTWREPELKRYKTIVNKPWSADVAGRQYRFEPGVAYWETADIKRHLFDGGYLDVGCLEKVDPTTGKMEDLGLHPAQLERVEAYSASQAYCHACHQRLNTRPTEVDDIMNGVK